MGTDDFNDATTARAAALDTLIQTAERVASAGDYGDMIGAVRLVELAAEQVRRAIIREARAAGDSWQLIGDALGTSRQNAHQRYGDLLVAEWHPIEPAPEADAAVAQLFRASRVNPSRKSDPIRQNPA